MALDQYPMAPMSEQRTPILGINCMNQSEEFNQKMVLILINRCHLDVVAKVVALSWTWTGDNP
jgi:hypothetical protein